MKKIITTTLITLGLGWFALNNQPLTSTAQESETETVTTFHEIPAEEKTTTDKTGTIYQLELSDDQTVTVPVEYVLEDLSVDQTYNLSLTIGYRDANDVFHPIFIDGTPLEVNHVFDATETTLTLPLDLTLPAVLSTDVTDHTLQIRQEVTQIEYIQIQTDQIVEGDI